MSFQSRSHLRTILVLLIALLTMMPVVAAASCAPENPAATPEQIQIPAATFQVDDVPQIDPCHQPPAPDQHALTITFVMPLAVGLAIQREAPIEARVAACPQPATGLSPPAIGNAPDSPPPNV